MRVESRVECRAYFTVVNLDWKLKFLILVFWGRMEGKVFLTMLWCRLVTMLLSCIINIPLNILGFKEDTTLQSNVYERLIIW